MMNEPAPCFICDSMLGGLAKWLRAAGYSAAFESHVDDGELVRRAFEQDLFLLTSDAGILDRYAVSQNLVRCVFVPLGLSKTEQLAHVMSELDLKLRESRCMRCNGVLEEVALADVRERIPPKVLANCRRFYRCDGCGKVYWRGTHWESIRARLRRVEALARSECPERP